MKVILLAGYRNTSVIDCPWLQKQEDHVILEHRIREARELSGTCVVVLSGETADEALRVCPSIEKCELIFDSSSTPNLLSNLRAALKHTGDPALVHPAELPLGSTDTIQTMVNWAVQQGLRTPAHLVQVDEGFPCFLTFNGCQEILRNTTLTGLADPQLNREAVLPQP